MTALEGIKRRANEIVARDRLSLTEALRRAAKEAGYPSYQIANNKLRHKR